MTEMSFVLKAIMTLLVTLKKTSPAQGSVYFIFRVCVCVCVYVCVCVWKLYTQEDIDLVKRNDLMPSSAEIMFDVKQF